MVIPCSGKAGWEQFIFLFDFFWEMPFLFNEMLLTINEIPPGRMFQNVQTFVPLRCLCPLVLLSRKPPFLFF